MFILVARPRCSFKGTKTSFAPWTAHGFDALLPQINLAAQPALHDVDRLLALLANRESA
jgi:hypothetical protein